MGPSPTNLPELLRAFHELTKHLGYWKALFILLVIMSFLMAFFIFKTYIKAKKDSNIRAALDTFTETASELVTSNNKQTILLNGIISALDKQYAENVTPDQCEVIVNTVMKLSGQEIYRMAEDIIQNNNISDSKDEIEYRVEYGIEVQWNENNSYLGKFRYKGIRLTEFIDDRWKTEIYESTVNTIFHCRGSVEKRLKTVKRNIKTHTDNIKLLALESIMNTKI